jgi:transcriptional regulator with XRE-family HTH domain
MSETFDGIKIRSVIKARGLKVKDLAQAIGVTPNTLSSALNGNRVLGKSALISLFRELNLDPETLKKNAS